jgi:hypothetical protein
MLLPANEPKNDFERNRLPERCLLSGNLGVGWIFPFHATESERRLARNRVFAAIFVANVVDFGFLLALASAALGSREWIWASILALGSFAAAVFIISSIQW